jgi:hypothetical protein
MLAILYAALFSLTPAHAGWSPIIACDNFGMVIDRDGYEYQLVIRNHADTLDYFTSRANINRALNDKGEMIVSVSPGGPGLREDESSSLYTGYISGATNVVISRVDATSIKVGIWEVGYRSTHNEEVANWVFRGCSFR